MSHRPSLEVALGQLDFGFSLEVTDRLYKYSQLLWDANQSVNLTRHTDVETFVARDVTDTIAIAKFIETDCEVLDIGSGGGVPGIILAILRPDLRIALFESVGKKAKLLGGFVTSLDIPVNVFHARAEQVLNTNSFDCCVARAVGPLWKLLIWLAPHWSAAGRLLAIKGPKWTAELADAKQRQLHKSVTVTKLSEYRTPQFFDSRATTAKSVILEIKANRAP